MCGGCKRTAEVAARRFCEAHIYQECGKWNLLTLDSPYPELEVVASGSRMECEARGPVSDHIDGVTESLPRRDDPSGKGCYEANTEINAATSSIKSQLDGSWQRDLDVLGSQR